MDSVLRLVNCMRYFVSAAYDMELIGWILSAIGSPEMASSFALAHADKHIYVAYHTVTMTSSSPAAGDWGICQNSIVSCNNSCTWFIVCVVSIEQHVNKK